MIYAVILAGGKGTRMGNTTKPKQFLKIADKPILVYTVNAFLNNKKIDRIVICLPKNWIRESKKIFKQYFKKSDLEKLYYVEGGSDRQSSLVNGCLFIKNNFGLNKNDIALTHDGVRPFVSQRIINDNINLSRKSYAIDTVVPATDTIVYSDNHTSIKEIPNRSELYYGQTPQTFNIKKLLDIFEKTTDKEKSILTDACKAFIFKGEKVELAKGEYTNIKITTKADIPIAEGILQSQQKATIT